MAAVSNARTGRRSYSPELGRWVSRDPIEERGGPNTLSLVANEPISCWDVLGLRRGEVLWIVYLRTNVKREILETATERLAALDSALKVVTLSIGEVAEPPRQGRLRYGRFGDGWFGRRDITYVGYLYANRKIDDPCWERVYASNFSYDTTAEERQLTVATPHYRLGLGDSIIGGWSGMVDVWRTEQAYARMVRDGDIRRRFRSAQAVDNWITIATMHELAHGVGVHHLWEELGGVTHRPLMFQAFPNSLMRPSGSSDWFLDNYEIETETRRQFLEGFGL